MKGRHIHEVGRSLGAAPTGVGMRGGPIFDFRSLIFGALAFTVHTFTSHAIIAHTAFEFDMVAASLERTV